MKIRKLIIPVYLTASLLSVTSCRKHTDPSQSQESSSEPSNSSTPSGSSSSSQSGPYMGASLTELVVGTGASKTKYSLGESLDTSGLYVNAIYADSEIRSLTSDQYRIDSSEFRNDREGVYNIHVIFNQGTIRKTATYTVTVSSILNKLTEKYLLGITASGMKTDYLFGEQLDTANLKVTATYSDYSEEDVTSKVTTDFTQYDNTTLGAYMLKFNYKETYTLGTQTETKSSDTFLLAVVDGKLKSIEFESGTTTIEQDTVGPDGTLSSIDMSDWKVKATFVNKAYAETTAYVSASELSISNFNSGMSGKQTSTISYTHGTMTRTCDVEINVNAIADPNYYFDASTLSQTADTTLQSDLVIDDVLTASNKCQIKMESSPKTFGNLSFTKRIQTNGKGNANSGNYIKFTLDKDASVAIIGRASSSSKPVNNAGFYDANNVLQSASYAYSTDISKYKYELKAGTYYFFDTDNAVQIYGIQIWYK